MAWSDGHQPLAETRILDGQWLLQLNVDAAESVTILLEGGAQSGPFRLVAGSLTRISFAAPPPQTFYGFTDVVEGSTIEAWNEHHLKIGQTVVADGVWIIQVVAAKAGSVSFSAGSNGELGSAGPFVAQSGSLTDFGFGASRPPMQFFGSAKTGSGALIDGAPAPDGTPVTAFNQQGALVGETTISNGNWLLQIDILRASKVRFTLLGRDTGITAEVVSGGLAAIRLPGGGPK